MRKHALSSRVALATAVGITIGAVALSTIPSTFTRVQGASMRITQPPPAYFAGLGVPYTIPAGNQPGALTTFTDPVSNTADIAITEVGGPTGVRVYRNNGDGTFAPSVLYPVNCPSALTTGIFDSSATTPDIAVADSCAHTVHILSAVGNGTFTTGPAMPTIPGSPLGLTTYTDVASNTVGLAVSDGTNNQVDLFRGVGDRTFSAPVTVSVGATPNGLLVDPNNSYFSRNDIFTANRSGGSLSVVTALNDGTFSPATSLTVGSGPIAVAPLYNSYDSHEDILTIDSASTTLENFQSNGGGDLFNPAITYTVGLHPRGIATGDLNGDGTSDVAVANNGSNTVSVLIQNADGSLASPLTYNVGSRPVGIAIADFTGAGRNGLAVANSLDNTITIYPALTGPQLTATAHANATAQANATATAGAPLTAVAQANATSTSQSNATKTAQAVASRTAIPTPAVQPTVTARSALTPSSTATLAAKVSTGLATTMPAPTATLVKEITTLPGWKASGHRGALHLKVVKVIVVGGSSTITHVVKQRRGVITARFVNADKRDAGRLAMGLLTIASAGSAPICPSYGPCSKSLIMRYTTLYSTQVSVKVHSNGRVALSFLIRSRSIWPGTLRVSITIQSFHRTGDLALFV